MFLTRLQPCRLQPTAVKPQGNADHPHTDLRTRLHCLIEPENRNNAIMLFSQWLTLTQKSYVWRQVSCLALFTVQVHGPSLDVRI